MPLCFQAVWGILGPRWAHSGLLGDAGWRNLGTGKWWSHRQRVTPAHRGDVSTNTGARDHLDISTENQLGLGLVRSSTRGCARLALDGSTLWGRLCSPTRRPRSPLVPDFSGPAQEFFVGFHRDAEMEAQFGRAPLASPPALALWTGASRPLLRAPRNVRSDGTLLHSATGARVLSSSFSGVLHFSARADTDATSGAARIFALLKATCQRS